MDSDNSALVGDATKRRLFGAGVDNLLALFAALLAASWIGGARPWAPVAVAVVVYLGYFLVQEATWSNTLGKRLFGLRLCLVSGERCGWAEASIRTALRVVEVNPIVLGALPAAVVGTFSKRHQRLGDMLAGTVVAQIERPLADEASQRDFSVGPDGKVTPRKAG